MGIISVIFRLLKEGIERGAFPGAVAGLIWQDKRYVVGKGYKAITPFVEPIEEDDIFDLASLTKPLATVFSIMYVLENYPNTLSLFDPLEKYLETDSEIDPLFLQVPFYRLLNHTSGLKAWYPFYQELIEKELIKAPPQMRLEYIIKRIKEFPLEYKPGEKSLYSDLGYILLGYIVEKRTGKSLEELFKTAKEKIVFKKFSFLDFMPLKKGIDQQKIVPTSVCPWEKKLLRGMVEDENTRALGGVSGAAGLFANIYGVLDILEFLLNCYHEKSDFSEILKTFINFKEEPSEFVLGFMLLNLKEKQLIGNKVSEVTVKHTGFTGTSILIDFENYFAIVLLTNRVHPNRDNNLLKEFRPYFYKEIVEDLFKKFT